MHPLSFDLARRYLFGKKSTNSINIITGISIFGISIGTAALILILSVFNGFEGLLSSLFNAFNPDLRIVPIEGKFFPYDSLLLDDIKALDNIAAVSATIEEVALFEYKDIQDFGTIKGVDDNYISVTRMDSLILDGSYKLYSSKAEMAVLGVGMRNKLSINIDDKLTPLTIYMPSRKQSMLGTKEYNTKYAYPAGVFSVQSDNDYQYVLTSYHLASQLIGLKNQASAIEIKLKNDKLQKETKAALAEILDSNLKIQTRYQQDETFLRVMNIEKWISFLIAGLTMLLVSFNLLGALWMISLDKSLDISILKSMGFQAIHVRYLFIFLGLLITLLGLFLGFSLALTLYYIQKEYGLIGVPSGFLIDAYPVKLKGLDFVIVTLSVLFIGFLASILPATKASKSAATLRSN